LSQAATQENWSDPDQINIALDRVGNQSDHRNTLAGLIRDQRSAVSACHGCHTAPTEAEPRPEVRAFAPLERAQWGNTVRQSEDEVFAGVHGLQFSIIGLLVISIACAFVIVYVMTHQVIEPVRALTPATRQIARGDLDSPMTARGSDELGALAQSFDTMRARLQNSIAEIQSWNRTLDARVQERTAALERAMQENARLYAELQKKEQNRGELLRRVITAQEDERMRIARELHDETS